MLYCSYEFLNYRGQKGVVARNYSFSNQNKPSTTGVQKSTFNRPHNKASQFHHHHHYHHVPLLQQVNIPFRGLSVINIDIRYI